MIEIGFKKAYQLLADKMKGWLSHGVEMLPNFVAAILILVAFYLLAKLARRLVKRTLTPMSDNQAVVGLIVTISGVGVFITGIFIALGILKLDHALTSLLTGVGVIGLAVGFAFRDIAANFMAGVILSIQHPFGIDDVIECKDFYGYIHDINLRATVIRTTEGQLVSLPNREILNSPLTNYTWEHKRRIDIDLGISYDEDHEKAQRLAIEAVTALEACDSDRPVELFYTEIDESAFKATLRFWVHFRVNLDFVGPRSEAIIAVGKIFAENNIDMPYPIRTLEFGAKDGAHLDEMLHTMGLKSSGLDPEATRD